MTGPVFNPLPNRSPISRQFERAVLSLTEPSISLLALVLTAATAFFVGWRLR